MHRALLLAVVLGACSSGDGDRYVGRGIAEVTPRHAPEGKRTSRAEDEEARLRRRGDGRLEVTLDECTFTTERAVAGRAEIAPGTPCATRRATSQAEVVVQRGDVQIDDAAGTLSVHLEGDGRASNLGSEVDVRYVYTFSGQRQ